MADDQIIKQKFDVESSKRRLRDIFKNFPIISFSVYLIFALSNFLLMLYLLFVNENDDTQIIPKLVKWSLLIWSVSLFLLNCLLFFPQFWFKKLIMIGILFVQTTLSILSLVVGKIYGHIGSNNFTLFMLSISVNILSSIFALVPIYFI